MLRVGESKIWSFFFPFFIKNLEVLNLSFGRFDGNPVCLIVVLWRWFSSFFGGIFFICFGYEF
jgi:hypothetical protein